MSGLRRKKSGQPSRRLEAEFAMQEIPEDGVLVEGIGHVALGEVNRHQHRVRGLA
jgi:hypothetical protein